MKIKVFDLKELYTLNKLLFMDYLEEREVNRL